MLMVVRVVLCIIHSNAEEESVFSRAKKNLTPQRASLELDRNLLRILSSLTFFHFHAGVVLLVRLSKNNRSVSQKFCIFSRLTLE